VVGKTHDLKERLNALRNMYQRTRGNGEPRSQRRTQYTEAETKYAAKIKKNIYHGRSTAI
jgi:hypothetical protein